MGSVKLEDPSLPAVTKGLDVMSPESELPAGAVRVASNVMLTNAGGFTRRPGFKACLALPHSRDLWKSSNGTVLAVAGGKLFMFDLRDPDNPGLALLYDGLADDPTEYADVDGDIYIANPAALLKLTANGIRIPGITNLLGNAPTLGITNGAYGSLTPGTYGVAYSLVNDLGEESGISSPAWIEASGGIYISGIGDGPDVVAMKLYATTPNGKLLFHTQTLPWASEAAIVDQKRLDPAVNIDLVPMPPGDFVRYWRSRTLVAAGAWLYISESMNFGLTSIHKGYVSFAGQITMLEPVESGIYVGFEDRVIFLRGTEPANFEHVETQCLGAGRGCQVTSDWLTGDVVQQRTRPVAMWPSPQGLAIGMPDGNVVLPQSERIRMRAQNARSSALRYQGIRQILVTTSSLELGAGAAADTP